MRCRRLLVAVLAIGAGCVETRIVRWQPMLAGLPGAETGMPVVRPEREGAAPPAPEKIVIETESGRKILIARTARDLMVHIHTTLREGDRALFVEQVLCELTKKECFERGVDPGELFDRLKAREQDVQALFNLMPAGEFSPGVVARTIGRGVLRVQVSGPGVRDLYWTGFDALYEKGNWRLRWFVQ
jgi:hypothetical protein